MTPAELSPYIDPASPVVAAARAAQASGSFGGDSLRLLERAHELDLAVYRAVAQHHSPLLDKLLPSLSRAADNSKLWVAVAAVLAVSGGARGRRAAVHGLSAVALTSALTNGPLKGLLRRARPDAASVPERRRRPMPATSSFPSGHSASALAFATGVSIAMPAVAPIVITLAAGVAVSRTYVGVHYPGDVLGGCLIGVIMGAALSPLRVSRGEQARA